ncbi:MAG: hypothetical protein LBU09_00315, partial [Endomicrobium sp.]|nr:hypothetical protein [Endomicrobium sp.]
MKKVFSVLSLIIFTASLSFAQMSLVPKVSVDIPASVEYDAATDAEDAKKGFDVSIEIRGTISEWFMWGAGASYMFGRGIAGF